MYVPGFNWEKLEYLQKRNFKEWKAMQELRSQLDTGRNPKLSNSRWLPPAPRPEGQKVDVAPTKIWCYISSVLGVAGHWSSKNDQESMGFAPVELAVYQEKQTLKNTLEMLVRIPIVGEVL